MSGPNVWGPHGWKFIHYVTLAYPMNPTAQQKQYYKNFFYYLGHVLPCSLCSNHYLQNLINLPLTDDILSDREKMINWAIDIHNKVNADTNKKIYSYTEARELIGSSDKCMEGFSNISQEKMGHLDHLYKVNTVKEEKIEPTNIFYLIGIICILITIAIIYKRK